MASVWVRLHFNNVRTGTKETFKMCSEDVACSASQSWTTQTPWRVWCQSKFGWRGYAPTMLLGCQGHCVCVAHACRICDGEAIL